MIWYIFFLITEEHRSVPGISSLLLFPAIVPMYFLVSTLGIGLVLIRARKLLLDYILITT